ncbi:inositol monophosphatase family protein [Streptomyces sp. CBMA152]|uniref:inositol monophosphatase family protein n=1 Tax=Streptomyces sp. CBMA152 TaxID=1896312 RepID=UPI002948BAFD|nr:inositol monophosphatase family protein [Streptomyces sp. CBMA152]
MDFAVRLAGRAGQMSARGFFSEGWHGHLKEDGSEFTDIDVAVEELIRDELSLHVPDDGVFGEEGGATSGSSGRRWIIDPINGTKYFTHRVPLFSNDLAYEDEHGPAIGVINMPMRQQMIVAGRGLGCWVLPGPDPDLRTGHRARVTERTSLGGAWTLMHNPAGWPEELLSALHRRVLLVPSTGMIAALVTGRADAGIIAGPPMGYEDVAPMPVIVTEAGGRVTDLGGASVLEGDMSVLVTNGGLHDEFLQLVKGLPRSRDYRALLHGD